MLSCMITIHSSAMAALIDKRQPFDLVDVRTEQEFRSFHIRGAQSFPLRELSAPKLLHGRKREPTEPLYIICNNRLRASLAAGMLTAAGCCHPVVVDGGMNTWVRQGLPVVCKKSFWNVARKCFRRGLVGVTRGVALVISGLFAVSSMVVSFQRSLEAKLDMVYPIPSKPR